MKTIEQLQEENAALAAQVEALRKHLDRAATNNGILSHHLRGRVTDRLCIEIAKDADSWRSALNSTPQHHLAEIRAEAGRAGFIAGVECVTCVDDDIVERADEYAEQIRQGEVE